LLVLLPLSIPALPADSIPGAFLLACCGIGKCGSAIIINTPIHVLGWALPLLPQARLDLPLQQGVRHHLLCHAPQLGAWALPPGTSSSDSLALELRRGAVEHEHRLDVEADQPYDAAQKPQQVGVLDRVTYTPKQQWQ
jgi:hypothetical protein